MIPVNPNRVPLLPQSDNNIPAALDVAPLLREVFQSELNVDVSMYKTKLNEEYFQKYEETCNEIIEMEKAMMQYEAKQLIESDEGNLSITSKSQRPKKLNPYEELSKSTLEKFHIIDTDRFFKSYEKMLFFPNEFDDALSMTHVSSVKSKFVSAEIGKKKLKSVAQKEKLVTSVQKSDSLKIAVCKSKRLSSALLSDKWKQFDKNFPHRSIFRVVPKEIVFNDCVVGNNYTANFILQNIGTVSKRFLLSPLKTKSAFSFDFEKPDHRPSMLAPGISVKFVVKYVCFVAKNYYETINIAVQDCLDLVVELKAIRETPILKVLPPITAPISSERYAVTVHTVECGIALPGDTNVINLNLYNNGSSSKFFIMSEEDWASDEITTVTTSNKLLLPEFIVYPAYFHVKKNSFFTLSVVFSPQEFGCFTERIFILCDNSTMSQLDLIGEGVVYMHSFIRFPDMEKVYSAAIDDDPSSNLFLSLNTMTCSGEESNTFHMYSECNLTLDFHWELSKYNPSCPNICQLDNNCIEISPKRGRLLPFSEIECTVLVTLRNCAPGSYRTILSLFIENLDEIKVPYTFKENLMKDEENGGMKLETAKIELWLECKRAEVVIVPYIVEFNGEPLLCNHPNLPPSYIQITNLSVAPVECQLLVPFNNFATISIEPSEFKIPVYDTVTCRVTINSLLPHIIYEFIKCFVNNGESVANIIVKGSLTQGRLLPYFDFYDFGAKQSCSSIHCVIPFRSLSYTQPFWRCYEYIFFEDDKKEECRKKQAKRKRCIEVTKSVINDIKMSAYVLKHDPDDPFYMDGMLYEFNETGKFCYKPNTTVERIWCSILTLDIGDSREFITVLADIQDPLISLSNCWLPILDDMILREPVTVSLKLRNHTALTVQFAWSHPIGHQEHDFQVKIEPVEGYLMPRTSLEIFFTLLPLKMGVKTCIVFPCFLHRIKEPLLFVITGLVKPLTVFLQWRNGNNLQSAAWPKFNINNNLVDWEMFKWANNLQYPDALCPFSFFKSRRRSEVSLCFAPLVNVAGSDPIRSQKPYLSEGLHLSANDHTDKESEYMVESDCENNGSESSSESSLYDIYQCYPIISGKYVINSSEFGQEAGDEGSSISEGLSKSDEINEEKNRDYSDDDRIYLELNENFNVIDNRNKHATFEVTGSDSSKSSNLTDGSVHYQRRKSIVRKITNYSFKIVNFNDSNEKLVQNLIDKSVGTIVFDNVCCWKAVKETIMMTSYVPEKTLLTVSVKTHKVYNPIKKFTIDGLLGKPKDGWEERIPEGQGLIIVPEPDTCELTGRDTIAINLWVYANTWGTYSDTLTITVGYLPPISLRVIVNICDNPIVFPGLYQPIIRMGCLPFRGDNKTYKLRVRNNCCVDVVIKWSVFMTDYLTACKRNQPFGLMLIDIDNVSLDCTDVSSDILKLIITPYYGKYDFNVYSLNKRQTFIKAWSEELLEITINLDKVKLCNASLNASLVGHVYKSTSFQKTDKKSSEYELLIYEYATDVVRNDCELIPPIIVNVTASVELATPILMNASKKDFLFKVCAIDVMDCLNEIYYVNRIIKFKNSGQSKIIFSITVQEPFSIKKIEKFDVIYETPETVDIELKPGEICEYTLQLGVKKVFIQDIILKTPLPIPKNKEEARLPPKLNRERKEIKGLFITQPGAPEQYKELEMLISFPTLRLSAGKIMFGPVYIGSTKCEQFYMFTEDPVPVYFEILNCDVDGNEAYDIFEFIPRCGFIQPKIPFVVHLYFTPSEPMDYKEKYVIKTAVLNHEVIFYAIGVGTLNYKDVHYESHL